MEAFLEEHVYSLAHWPFLAWAFMAMLIGQVSKTAIWTRARAYEKSKMQWLFWWAYKTLPLHPVVVGALLGLAWRDPEGRGWPWPAAVCYFGAAGAASVWLYQILKGLLKKRGVVLGPLPGESEKPPPDDERDTPVSKPPKKS